MKSSNLFQFEVIETVKAPCATCFWGGAALIAAAVVAAT